MKIIFYLLIILIISGCNNNTGTSSLNTAASEKISNTHIANNVQNHTASHWIDSTHISSTKQASLMAGEEDDKYNFKQFIYVLNRPINMTNGEYASISTYEIDESTLWEKIVPVEIKSSSQSKIKVSDFNISKDGRFLYVSAYEDRYTLISYMLDYGKLNEKNRLSISHKPGKIVLSNNDNFAYEASADKSGKYIYAYSVNQETGTLTPLDSAKTKIQSQYTARDIAIDNSGQYLFVTTDNIEAYKIQSDGSLKYINSYHLDHPSKHLTLAWNNYMYANDPNYNDYNVENYLINLNTGELSNGNTNKLAVLPLTLAIPNGSNYAYILSGGSQNVIYVYQIENGKLTHLIDQYILDQSAHYSDLGVDATGRYLYALGETNNVMRSYQINLTDGKLKGLSTYPWASLHYPQQMKIATVPYPTEIEQITPRDRRALAGTSVDYECNDCENLRIVAKGYYENTADLAHQIEKDITSSITRRQLSTSIWAINTSPTLDVENLTRISYEASYINSSGTAIYQTLGYTTRPELISGSNNVPRDGDVVVEYPGTIVSYQNSGDNSSLIVKDPNGVIVEGTVSLDLSNSKQLRFKPKKNFNLGKYSVISQNVYLRDIQAPQPRNAFYFNPLYVLKPIITQDQENSDFYNPKYIVSHPYVIDVDSINHDVTIEDLTTSKAYNTATMVLPNGKTVTKLLNGDLLEPGKKYKLTFYVHYQNNENMSMEYNFTTMPQKAVIMNPNTWQYEGVIKLKNYLPIVSWKDFQLTSSLSVNTIPEVEKEDARTLNIKCEKNNNGECDVTHLSGKLETYELGITTINMDVTKKDIKQADRLYIYLNTNNGHGFTGDFIAEAAALGIPAADRQTPIQAADSICNINDDHNPDRPPDEGRIRRYSWLGFNPDDHDNPDNNPTRSKYPCVMTIRFDADDNLVNEIVCGAQQHRNWHVMPNSPYFRSNPEHDDTLIGVTGTFHDNVPDSNYSQIFGSPDGNYAMNVAISPIANHVFTGSLNGEWLAGGNMDTCQFWTSNNPGISNMVGLANNIFMQNALSVFIHVFDPNIHTCAMHESLYCADTGDALQ